MALAETAENSKTTYPKKLVENDQTLEIFSSYQPQAATLSSLDYPWEGMPRFQLSLTYQA